ncbi:MAG TPA: thioesterase family protein, partial [Flavobacteriales bacterium]|nr:thioesterase family protein [Flavobacteriales bacterium]
MKITTPVQVRFSDLDMARHVHNAVYLEYFELGRMDLLRQFMEPDHDWVRTGLILARNEVDHRRPIHLADPVQVQTWCGRIGDKSYDLQYAVQHVQDGTIFAEGRSVLVAFDYHQQASIALPQAWRTALARFMEAA